MFFKSLETILVLEGTDISLRSINISIEGRGYIIVGLNIVETRDSSR